MQLQGCGDNLRAPNAGPYTYAGEHTAEIQRVTDNGVPEGEELANDIRQARKSKVPVRQQAFLGGGILREYGGIE